MEETKKFIYELFDYCRGAETCDRRRKKCKECFELLGEYTTPNDVIFELSYGGERLIKRIHERRCKECK